MTLRATTRAVRAIRPRTSISAVARTCQHGRMQPLPSEYDRSRAAALRRARRRATGLLAIVAVVFLSTFAMGEAAWVGFLRATAEAAMIGGVADWFAVTALFRHPLGVPIPHTAIIPRSKEGLGQNLAEFVRHNFLSPDQVVERLESADLPARLGRWLADPWHADQVSGYLAQTIAAVAEGIETDAVESDIERMVADRLRALPMAEMVGRGMEAAVREGQHRPLMHAAITGIAAAMDDNRVALRRRLGQESPWWVPSPVDDAVFQRAFDALHRFLGELAADPDHEIRKTIDARLEELAVRLQTDEALGAIVADRIDDLVAHPEFRAWSRGLWSSIAKALAEASSDRGSQLRRRLTEALAGLGSRLTEDDALRARADTWLRSLAPPLAEVGQREIGDLIGVTIDRWDPHDTSRRLELWMGRDLQFVRINGTVVGGLVGLAIHALVVTFGG